MLRLRKILFGILLAAQFAVVAPALAVGYTNGLSDAGQTGGYSTTQNLAQLIGSIISAVLGVLGIVFLLLTIYSGFIWMTAAGDEKKIQKAKSILVAAVVGLVIVLSSYGISNFILLRLQVASIDTSAGPSPWDTVQP